MLRGNTVMKGYLKNPARPRRPFAAAGSTPATWRCCQPDGYIEIKDRSKDVIISGGENISSLEVEEALYRHPKVMEAAVVARPDRKWGESPCAFVTLKPDEARHAGGDHRLLPGPYGRVQVPEDRGVRAAAQDLDRQDPEVRAARTGVKELQ